MFARGFFSAELFAATTLLMLSPAAFSFTIDPASTENETFTISWELAGEESQLSPVAAGSASFEFLGIRTSGGSSLLQFGLTVDNLAINTGTQGFTGMSLAKIGFTTDIAPPQIDPTASVAPTGSGTPEPNLAGTPSGDADPDDNLIVACVPEQDAPNNPDANRCVALVPVTANGGEGLAPGESQTFEFELDLGQMLPPGTQVDLSQPQVELNPLTPTLLTSAGVRDDTRAYFAAVQIPVPGSLLLLAAGAFGLHRIARRG